MRKITFKSISIILLAVIIYNAFLTKTWALSKEILKTYVRADGSTICYYENQDGSTYVYENGEKIFVAIPVERRVLTDEEVQQLIYCDGQNRSVNYKTLPYSKTLNVGTGAFTDIIYLNYGRDSIYLKCSNYSPIFGNKGMSYYIFYSTNGSTWISELFINKNLSTKLRHFVYDSYYQYIKIRMWSYSGDINTCKLSIT